MQRVLLTVPLLALASQLGLSQATRDLPRWTLSATPTVRIGQEGDPNREFTRITGVVRMPTGEIVVGNGATQELRVFSPRGEFLRSLSRQGSGPGEFRNLGPVSRAADTLFVIERGMFGPTHLHAFTLADGFLTRHLLRASNAPRGVGPLARLSTGELLVSLAGTRAIAPPELGTVRRDSMELAILHLGDPGEVTSLGTFLSLTWAAYRVYNAAVPTSLFRFTLGPDLVLAASRDRAWIGDTGTGVIKIFGGRGELLGEVTPPIPPRGFRDDALERARLRALAIARDKDDSSRVEAMHDRRIRPSTVPRFTRFVPGPDGKLWIETFEEDPAAPREMVVLSRTGQPLARVSIPGNVALHEAGPDYVTGVETDADGIERVVVYRLRR